MPVQALKDVEALGFERRGITSGDSMPWHAYEPLHGWLSDSQRS